MDEIIQIKCPFDGAVLSVRNLPGIENKTVTCPICKHRYPFSQYRRVTPAASGDDPDTEYPGGAGNTSYNPEANYTTGILRQVGTSASYRLKPGRNVVGRKASKSGADFGIDTGDKKSMSREHLVVEVRNVPTKGLVHYASLYKEKVNPTFIGTEQLMYGDCIVLRDGDELRLPDAVLRFEIPDEEGTRL